jgi:cell division protein FtsB
MNPKNSESKMGKDKIALAVCFCLIVALIGFSSWLYIGAKGLESKISDLQTKTDGLEAQNAGLSAKVQNLTWTLGNLTSGEDINFIQTEQITYTSYAWGANDAYLNLTVKNTGSVDLSITQVQIDFSPQTSGVMFYYSGGSTASIPYALTKGNSVTIKIVYTFTSGAPYNVIVITAKGNQFGPYTLTAP